MNSNDLRLKVERMDDADYEKACETYSNFAFSYKKEEKQYRQNERRKCLRILNRYTITLEEFEEYYYED